MKDISKMLETFSINKYYRMSDVELEKEASKWKIRSYGNQNGTIERQIIIDSLLIKDSANNSRCAFVISLLATVVSIVSNL